MDVIIAEVEVIWIAFGLAFLNFILDSKHRRGNNFQERRVINNISECLLWPRTIKQLQETSVDSNRLLVLNFLHAFLEEIAGKNKAAEIINGDLELVGVEEVSLDVLAMFVLFDIIDDTNDVHTARVSFLCFMFCF